MKRFILDYGANGFTAERYAWLRIALGSYLTLHFGQLLPWAAELFSARGVLPDPEASPFHGLFPNLLAAFDSPLVATGFLASAVVASAALAWGRADRLAAVHLIYVLACTFTRNPLIANPSLPFVGWMLAAHALVAPSRREREAGWRLPAPVFACAWIVMAAGYTYSGVTKLVSPSWLDGTAIADVLANPLARPTVLRSWLLEGPAAMHAAMTWGALALELSYLPLALSRRARPFLWLAMVGMHVGLIVLIDFADLSVGMLLLHAFTFDPDWLLDRPWTPAPLRAHRGLELDRQGWPAR